MHIPETAVVWRKLFNLDLFMLRWPRRLFWGSFYLILLWARKFKLDFPLRREKLYIFLVFGEMIA